MPLPNAWTHADILALSLAPRMKSVDLRRLVQEYDSLDALVLAVPHEITKSHIRQDELFVNEQLTNKQPSPLQKTLRGDSLVDALRTEAEVQRQLCETNDVRTVSFWDDDYPMPLKEIFYPPSLLYVRGVLQSADAVAIAIVGTRHCTDYGKMVTEQYAARFAEAGIIVASGLATGVDTYAHKAVLENGGRTYAVIASGIDKMSSSAARQTAKDISIRGAVVSEYPCGTPAMPAYFPRRNRIISGVSQGVLVVESGERGGSLITAQFAIDQNRELFAIPGRIYSDRSRGTNMLLQRSQAHCTLSPEDMLQTLGLLGNESRPRNETKPAPQLFGTEASIYAALQNGDPVQIEALSAEIGAPVQDLLVALLDLEFKGLVRQLAGKQFMRV
jgi:DNA processing protein